MFDVFTHKPGQKSGFTRNYCQEADNLKFLPSIFYYTLSNTHYFLMYSLGSASLRFHVPRVWMYAVTSQLIITQLTIFYAQMVFDYFYINITDDHNRHQWRMAILAPIARYAYRTT